MRVWKDRPQLLRGRLHGRLLMVLGAVAALAAAVAAWQFAANMGGGEDELAILDDDQLNAGLNDVASSTGTASTSASASPTAEASTEPTPEQSKSPSAEPSDPATTGEPEPTGPQCVATLHLDAEWGNTITVTVEVANTGEESFEGWEVVLDIEDVEVTATWGMDHVEGDRYGNGWINGELDPGESTEPSFSGERKGNPDLPETVPCSPTGS